MHVVILGLARQGKALARFFAEQGAQVTVSDVREAADLRPALDELRDLPLRYALGGHPLALLEGCDLLCLSGGVPADLPMVQAAAQRGIPISNDAREFLKRCPAPVVGITGSAGKTTTTRLVGDMLAASGFTTWVGGNIGNPLIGDLARMRAEDRVVMELSSFQLELLDVSPSVAGVLNITPNHLDRHGTMAAYIAAKRNIVAHQGPGGIAVLGYDEPNARALAGATPAQVRYFSRLDSVPRGAFLRPGETPSTAALVLRGESGEEVVCRRSDLRLRGAHNVANALAAIALAQAAGARVDAMRSAIAAFAGVEHRLEEVRRWNGALWVNDSIATAPERVLAALDAFDEPLILLAGGRDKDLPWAAFAERVVERVRVLVTFGEAAALIQEHVEAAWHGGAKTQKRARGKRQKRAVALEEIVAAETLVAAVPAAAQRARPGDVVLLSPGGTSFDAYRDFAARGEHFRALVNEL